MPYFTTTELRALPDMDDTVRFPTARCEDAHDYIVAIIERECGTSFIAVEVTETLNGTGTDTLFLSSPYVQSIDEVTVDGEALTSGEVDGLLLANGVAYRPSGYLWASTARNNVVITYTAGYSTTPPADLKEAAMRGARNWLLTSDAWRGVDARATSLTNDYGNIQLSTPGEGRPTGVPDVDATIMAWARRVRVPAIA